MTSNRERLSIVAAALAALAVFASGGRLGQDGMAEFFLVLSAAAVLVTVGVASGRPPILRLAQVVAVAWDLAVAYALFLLAFSHQLGSSPTPGPTPTFLAIPVLVYHAAAAYGGAVLVTVAAFGPPKLGLVERRPSV